MVKVKIECFVFIVIWPYSLVMLIGGFFVLKAVCVPFVVMCFTVVAECTRYSSLLERSFGIGFVVIFCRCRSLVVSQSFRWLFGRSR